MERITYILGAGFSAPLGLPVMRDFLAKSKDMYFSDVARYTHFDQVFSLIRNLSIAKNYFDTDLFNIEEILSILEMQVFVEKRRLKKAFLEYICDVITYHTPHIKAEPLPGNWQDFVFGRQKMQMRFGHFVGNVLGLEISQAEAGDQRGRHFTALVNQNPRFHYSIVTLNYDMVIENFAAFINRQYEVREPAGFHTQFVGAPDSDRPALAKLHGTVESGLIIPPTWAKGTHRRIAPIWKKAFELLESSNQIRVIGYSLPVGDAYVKYLLKASVINALHLKKIDVICLDPSGEVKERYESFIKFGEFRFRNAATEEYLELVQEMSFPGGAWQRAAQNPLKIAGLEKAHEQFMGRGGG